MPCVPVGRQGAWRVAGWAWRYLGVVCLCWVACGAPDATNSPGDESLPGSPPGVSDGGGDVPDAGDTPTQSDGGAADAGTSPGCTLVVGPPRWLLEGESLTAQVSCAPGADGVPTFSVENLPPGATFDVASGTLRWTPGRDQAAVWLLRVREVHSGATDTLKIGVAENESAPGNVRIVDPQAYTEEYGLPVIHLSYGPTGLTAGGYRTAHVVYRGKRYDIEAKYRGSSSSAFPKRSITLKFADEQLFTEPVMGEDFTDRKRIVLVSTFNDNSYLRTRLAFDLWAKMSPRHLRLHAFSAIVYANNRYVGLYTVADHADKRLLAREGLSTKADLFKAVDANANFSRLRRDGTAKSWLGEGLAKEEGRPAAGQPHSFDTFASLIAFTADATDGGFRDGLAGRADLHDYMDWWIFNTLILGTDSHSKNAYHARDPSPGKVWRFLPWDLDASFGQNFDTTRTSPQEWKTFATNNLLFARMLAEPTFSDAMHARYRAFLANELNVHAVQSLVEGYVREIAPSARRDWAKWRSSYVVFGSAGTNGEANFPNWQSRDHFNSYDEEVEFLREWINARWQLLGSRVP
ncbi:hypothetical protein DRW03_08270 [Corallococcus sp. H22C18031201]|nr:hypothetical protein DRW03_08270 [Corallococcus sp. H22C18031201]